MKINKIALQNFRAFHSFEDKLKFENKSVLIYGENGSGKSSIFWALHAFVHYYNNEAKSKSYFTQGDDRSLLNLFNATEDGFIKITFDDDNEYIYDQSGMSTGIQTQLTNLSRVKSFLTYKDLLGLDMMHSYENEIFAKKILLELLTGDITLVDAGGSSLGSQVRLERMEILLRHPLDITYYKKLEDFKDQLFGDIENLEFLYSGEVGEVEIEDKEGDIIGLEFNAISPMEFAELKALDDRVKAFIEHYDSIFDDDVAKQNFIDNWEGSISEIEHYVEGIEAFNAKAEMYKNVYPDSGEVEIGAYIDNIETRLSDFEENVLDKDFSTKFNTIFDGSDTVEKLYSDWQMVRSGIETKIHLMNTGINKIKTLLGKLGYENIDVVISLDYGNTKILDFDVSFNGVQVEHHKFLNEAKLSAINLAFYFSAILSYTKPDIPILVLDDLLISLDMGNRAKVLELITDQSLFEGYQLFILTHDRAFFDRAKQILNYHQRDQWKYFEMYVDIDDTNNIEIPHLKIDDTYSQRAKDYFMAKDYPASANYLRKEVERLYHKKLGLDKLERIVDLARKEKNLESIESRLKGIIGALRAFELCEGIPRHKRTKKCTEFSKNVLLSLQKLESMLEDNQYFDIGIIKDYLLNPLSHDDFTKPFYGKELNDAMEMIEELEIEVENNIGVKLACKRQIIKKRRIRNVKT